MSQTNVITTKTKTVNPLTNLASEAAASEAAASEAAASEAAASEAAAPAPAPVKKQATKRTVRRRERNKAGKVRLLNFTAVFKDVRSNDFGLPNRVKESHISGKEKQIKVICLSLCSESLKNKSENHFYFNRFPKLITDLKYLKSFMTERQLNEIDEKIWSNMQIVDLIVKGLTANESSIKKS